MAEANLYYSGYKGIVTNDMLDKVYGDISLVTRTEREATRIAGKHKNARITRLIDYRPCDVNFIGGRCVVTPGAEKQTVGFLVNNLDRDK